MHIMYAISYKYYYIKMLTASISSFILVFQIRTLHLMIDPCTFITAACFLSGMVSTLEATLTFCFKDYKTHDFPRRISRLLFKYT